jgi:hypothetical protein
MTCCVVRACSLSRALGPRWRGQLGALLGGAAQLPPAAALVECSYASECFALFSAPLCTGSACIEDVSRKRSRRFGSG